MRPPRITGTPGNDTLYGTAAADTFDGGTGSDTFVIRAGGGFDSYADTGTTGTDRIVAQGRGASIGLASGFGPANGIEEISAGGFRGILIRGGIGDDFFDFSATALSGIASIQAGKGNDYIIGSAGADVIGGNNGSDVILGGAGDDRLMGGAGNDFDPVIDGYHGADGNDFLDGGAGNDTLAGGSGNDELFGGAGDDVLQGGSGVDRLTGGPGADVFRYAAATDGGDYILDFDQSTDVIDLSAIGSCAFAGESASALSYGVTYWHDGAATVVSIEATGDRVADMTLTLSGTFDLTALDFIL